MSADDTPLLALIRRDDEHPALVAPGARPAAAATGATVSPRPPREVVTYARLHALVAATAASVAAAGVRPGDAVASALGNAPGTIVAFLGTVAAGAAAAPLNPAYTAAEFRSYLSDVEPAAMLLPAGSTSPAREVCADLGIRVVELGDPAGPAAQAPPGDPEAVALLLHTSGTTSRPKSVALRQRHLVASTRTIAAGYGLGPDDVAYCVMPLFHVHGLVASALSTLVSGGTVVVPERLVPSAFWADVRTHGVTWYTAVPTLHQAIVARAGEPPGAGHALRFARSCSAALAPALQEAVEARLGIPLVQAYGMTEAAHQMTSNPLPPEQRRPGSVGRATGTEIAILDEEWRALPAGSEGEVAVRGPSVIAAYRDAPEANAASFRDGWFRTGDSGVLSADGYLTLRGRLKELINRGGEKLSPHEIEDALLAHPAVAEAVAYAVPHDTLGEVAAAAVVLAAPAEPAVLRAHCAERLAAFKVPRSITVVDEIPKGPTAKVQRRRLGELIGG